MEENNESEEIQEEEVQQEAQEEEVTIPEGFDEELYDTSAKALRQDKVAERLKNLNDEVASAKKQANDMRKKLSKGTKGFETVEEYGSNFVPDEKYDTYLKAEDNVGKHLNEVLGILNKYSYDHNLSAEASKDLNNLFLGYAEDLKIIDTRTAEEKQEALAQEKAKIGDNAQDIIDSNVKWIKEVGIFNQEEKDYFTKLIDKDALCNTGMHKLLTLIGATGSSDIPVRGNIVSGLADDYTLASEYYSDNTSDARRMEILQQRIDAGRSGGLPMPR